MNLLAIDRKMQAHALRCWKHREVNKFARQEDIALKHSPKLGGYHRITRKIEDIYADKG